MKKTISHTFIIVCLGIFGFSFNAQSTPSVNNSPYPDMSKYLKLDHPVIIKSVTPIYPEDAKKKKITGTVIVVVGVGLTGKVEIAYVVQGNKKILNNEAVKAARNCIYKPVLLNGSPIKFQTQIEFKFKLD